MYDLTLVLKTDLTEERKQEILNYAQETIKKSSVESSEFKINHLGEKKFVLPVKKNLAGDLWQITFSAKPFQTKTLNEKLKIIEEVLRFLVVKLEKEKSPPSYETSEGKGGNKEKN